MKKKLILIIVPLVLIGTVLGLAFMGIINIPGITPKKAETWQATLKKIYTGKGSVKGDLVIFKDLPKADQDAFVAAANKGGLKATVEKDGIKSAQLVAWLKKEATAPEKPKPVAVKPTQTPPPVATAPKKEAPTTDTKPEVGAQTIADLWNGIDVAKLVPIIKAYKDPELATILLKMEPEHVSELLAQLPADKAAALSRELQKQGAIVPITKSGDGT
jgi:hypothetical protein